MSNYKEASKLQLRFRTTVGDLTVEQLWDLPLAALDNLAVDLQEQHKNSGKKSFLVTRSRKDKVAKLRFDIMLDVLQTKVEENEVARNAADKKAHNQKILSLIKDKEDETLKGKSVKQLEKMLM